MAGMVCTHLYCYSCILGCDGWHRYLGCTYFWMRLLLSRLCLTRTICWRIVPIDYICDVYYRNSEVPLQFTRVICWLCSVMAQDIAATLLVPLPHSCIELKFRTRLAFPTGLGCQKTDMTVYTAYVYGSRCYAKHSRKEARESTWNQLPTRYDIEWHHTNVVFLRSFSGISRTA